MAEVQNADKTWDLSGRVALVTGASSGIGAHLAILLARAGASVVLGARRLEKTTELAAEIIAAGGKAIAVPLDVTDEASVANAFSAAEKAIGTVDTVIANAGISRSGRSTDVPIVDVRSVIETNFTGLFLTVREAVKRLAEVGGARTQRGRVILIGSITADMTNQGDAAYAASKAAVASLGRQFAREWARLGVNINTIQPGYIRTELTSMWSDTEAADRKVASWPRRRFMDIDALDDAVLFLCSDRSRFVTGALITIDDGQSL